MTHQWSGVIHFLSDGGAWSKDLSGSATSLEGDTVVSLVGGFTYNLHFEAVLDPADQSVDGGRIDLQDADSFGTWATSFTDHLIGDQILDFVLTPVGSLVAAVAVQWSGTGHVQKPTTVTWWIDGPGFPTDSEPETEPGLTLTIGETDITDAFEKTIRVEKDGVGQGQFSINRYSTQATAANLAQGNVVKVTYPQISPDPIFAFFLETGDFNLVSTDEEGGENLTFAGRGVRSILRRAVMWDRSYLSTTKAILGPGHRWVYTKSGSDLVSRASILFTPQAIYDVDSIETLDWPGHGDKYIGRTYGRLSSGPQSGKYVHVSWLATPYAGTGEWKLWAFGDKPGEILYRIIAEAQAASRPQHPLSALTLDFTATTDSDGNAWASSDATTLFTVQIGENLDDICQRLIDTGDIAVVCDPDLVLHAYNTYGRDLHSTTFAADKVRFAKGVNIADVLTRSRAPELPATHVLVDGDGEITGTAELADAGDRPTVEIYASLEGSSESDLSDAGLALLNEGVTRLESAIFKIAVEDDPENGLYLPGPEGTDGHFWVADLVTLNTGSTDIDYVNRSETVAAITLSEDEAANLIVIPELGSVTHDARPERELRYGRYEGVAAQSQGRGVIPGRVLVRAPTGESAQGDAAQITAVDVDVTAADVTYDNGTSGLTADDVQAAIDELAAAGGGGGAIDLTGDTGSASTIDDVTFAGAGGIDVTVTDDGGGAATVTIDGSGVSGGGGGGSGFPLDSYSIDGTYGNDFAGASLPAMFTRRNFTSGAETYQVGPGASRIRIATASRSAGDGYYWTAPSGDWTLAMRYTIMSTSLAQHWGLMVVDTNGTGVGVGIYHGSPCSFLLQGITTYTGSGGTYYEANYGSNGSPNINYLSTDGVVMRPLWLYLRKSGTNYYTAASLDGVAWSPEGGPLAWAGTVDRWAMGLVALASTSVVASESIDVDWVNKIA